MLSSTKIWRLGFNTSLLQSDYEEFSYKEVDPDSIKKKVQKGSSM